MLRSFSRAVPSSSSIRRPLIRNSTPIPRTTLPLCLFHAKKQHTRSVATHAISNPTLAQIEKRWEDMTPQAQAEIWMALRDRMKNDWHEMTLQERRAAYWIAFGPYGPRAVDDPAENWNVFKLTMTIVGISTVVFFIIQAFARPAPKTMNAQYQQMTNEYLKKQKVEPITGLSSEGYKGKGMVQSKPRKGGIPSDDDDE